MDRRLAQLPCGYINTNEQYTIIDVNETFLQWTNYRLEELYGQHLEKLFSSSSKLIFHSYFYPNMAMYQFVDELFINIQNAAGQTMPCLVNAKQVNMEGENFVDIVMMPMNKRIEYEREVRQAKLLLEEAYNEKTIAHEHLQQINKKIEEKQQQLIQMNEELQYISNTDNLTGIGNRRFFHQKLQIHIEQFNKHGIPFSLLVMDIDHFKQVNDIYGHAIGDLVLAQLGVLLKTAARDQDIPARFGGEEFILLLGQTDEEKAFEIAQQLIKQFEKTIWPSVGRLTVSIGSTTFKKGDTESSVFEHADDALYESKRNGRNQATQYEAMKRM
ncbi:MAG: sensor domain-containing diguanylate cyclase [Solibacillus sp.]